jgi:antitoxin component YwqK of YwqJK toxin-antitoxin module
MLYEYGKLLKEEFFNEMTETIGLIDYQKMAKDEIVQFQYPSGQLRASYAFLNAKRHGESIEYDATGAKLNEGQYLNGEMHGTWKYYGPNGKLRMEATLNNGKLHGSYNSYYPNGNLEDQYQYHLGQLEGTTLNYAEDGITITGSTEYLNGENHGKRIFRDSNGNIQLIRHYNHGILLGYSYLGTDGEEVPMIPLENESGKVIAYYQNGQLSREMDYQNGYLVGPYKTYFLNGNLYREHFNLNDDYHGVEKIYFESGKIKEENSYSYGDLHGESKKYYENGQVKEIANYLNDEKTGENTFFDSEGTLLRMDTYFNGLRIKSISYASSSK